MVTTHSESEWLLLRSLRNQGRADSGGWLEHATARLQLPARRHRRGDRPRAAREARRDSRGALRGCGPLRASSSPTCPGSSFPAPTTPTTSARGSCTSSRCPLTADREAVIASLSASGVQTARYLPCIHLQPYMQERFGFRVGLCPVAEEIASRTLAIPFHARLAEDDQAYVATRSANPWSSGARPVSG